MFQKILVPLDGSKLAEAALPVVTTLVKPAGQLVLVRVVPELWIDDPLMPTQREDLLTRIRQSCQTYLDGIAEPLRKDGIDVDVLVASGAPADQILGVAALAHCDLITMATHGHSGFKRLMLGSVADKVIHQSDIPVLLVRSSNNLDEPQGLDIAVPLTLSTPPEPQNLAGSRATPWQVKSEEMPDGDAQARLRHLLRYAILAPSTHNTQPWKFEVNSDEIRIYADHSRWLKVADADERELYVSVGCALENLLIAAEHYGYAHEVHLLPDTSQRDLIALVRLSASGIPSPHRAGLFDCMTTRRSDHSIYHELPVRADLLSQLQNVCVEPDLKSMFITDEATRHQINQLVARADAVQFADPAFREELGQYVGQGAFGASWFMSKLQQMAVTLIDMGDSTARQDSKALMSAPVLGVITSHEDTRQAQVQAGQVYERMNLLATHLQLSMQPMNQLLQQRYFKSALSDVLFAERVKATYVGSHQPVAISPTPQMAFRLGYGESNTRHTPRRPLEEVLGR